MNQAGKDLYNPKSVAPSVFIPSWLIQVSTKEISNNAKMLYGRLSQWSNEKGHVHRSSPQLAKELGTTTRNIERQLKELRDLNLIGTYQATAGGINHFEFYIHPWMSAEIVQELCFNTNTPPTNLTVPPDKSDGTPPSNMAGLKYKEIKRNISTCGGNLSETERLQEEAQGKVQKLFKKHEIKVPKKLTKIQLEYVQKAIVYLDKESPGLELEGYLEYLVNECAGLFMPYESNGRLKQIGFSNILRPSFIKKALSKKYEDHYE